MARFEKTLRNLREISSHTKQLRAGAPPSGGELDPKAVAAALDQHLGTSDTITRSIAHKLGYFIAFAIRGRGQIDFTGNASKNPVGPFRR